MRRIHLTILTTALLASFCPATLAQNTRPPAKDPANRAQSVTPDNEREKEAVNTLLYLRSSANEIDPAADRVRVLLEIADALWLSNKDIAIDVFRQSFNQAAAADAAIQSGDSLLQSRPLQQSVVNRIAKRDPGLARTLLLATTSEKEAKQANAFGDLYGVRGNHDEMLIEAASSALSSDSREAAQIARTAAADGFSQPMRTFLVNLRAKDRAASDALFEQLLQNASSRSPKQLLEALFLWDYAFQRKSVYFGGVGWFRESPTEYPIRPDLKTKSLLFAVDALVENAQQFYLANASADDKPLALQRYAAMYSLAAQILPDAQALAPAAAPTIMALMNRLNQEMTEQAEKPPAPLEPLPASADDNSDIDQLLERAVKAPNSATKDALYARAAYRLYLSEEYGRALEVARNIDNADLQLKVTEPLRFDWVGSLIKQNKLEPALTIARGIQTLELRAAALVRLAADHIQKRNQQQALALLNEAEDTAGKARPSVYLASAVLGVAQLYLQIDNPDQAQQATANAIQLMNAGEEHERWGLLGKSSASQRVNTEWISVRGEGVSVRSTYPKLAGLLEVLSKIAESRLDAGLMLARDIKPKALNFATQAALCRQVVERAHASHVNAVKTAATR